MEDNGLRGNLKQPDNFTTCGKLNLEIKQYNNPKEVSIFAFVFVFAFMNVFVLVLVFVLVFVFVFVQFLSPFYVCDDVMCFRISILKVWRKAFRISTFIWNSQYYSQKIVRHCCYYALI